MYFSKKIWNTILFIYKYQFINFKNIYLLRNEINSYLPKLFKFLKFILLYNGKIQKLIKIKKTTLKMYKLL